MEARVRAGYRWRMVTACAGCEFIQGEWRPVPAGLEEEAAGKAFLETRAGPEPMVPAQPELPNPELADEEE